MENNIIRNNFQLLAHNNNYSKEPNTLKSTQKSLKEIRNGKLSENLARALPAQMLNSLVKSVMEGLPVLETVCNELQWVISSSNTKSEEGIMEQNKWINGFIDSLKLQDDFLKCYVFEENEVLNVWIILQETGLDQNLKYMKLYREFNENKRFNILLFEQDEEKEVLEQISYINEKYKEVISNG